MDELSSAVRWHLKKCARRGVAAVSIGCHRLAAGTKPRVRVLTYHRFGDTPRDPFSVTTETFDRQMSWLARLGLAVSLTDLETFLAGGRSLPDGAVLVTIDDGAPSVHARALPILLRHAIPAVVYVPAGEIGTGAPDDEGPNGRMAREHLLDLVRNGIVVGSHGFNHRSLARMSPREAREQATRSRATLEDILGTPIRSFAYPFGTRADFSAATAAILREAGYTSAFTSQHGAIVPGADPLALPRVKVEGGEGMWMFQALARGGLDGWRWIDRTLWKMQAAEA